MDASKLLRKVLDKCPGGSREMAAVLGTSESLIFRWLSPDSKVRRYPSLRNARALEVAYGIPMQAWAPDIKMGMETTTVRKILGK